MLPSESQISEGALQLRRAAANSILSTILPMSKFRRGQCYFASAFAFFPFFFPSPPSPPPPPQSGGLLSLFQVSHFACSSFSLSGIDFARSFDSPMSSDRR